MWTEPDIVGWLDKRGGKFTSWKKRFFVLQGSYLFYFEDDFKVQAKTPLGVIPLDASNVEMKSEESGDRRYAFNIRLGKQFLGYSKRDTYVIAAPSRQALEEWVQRLKTAAETREVLLDQLRKARWRGGDLRKLLANSMGNREILEFTSNFPEGQALMTELMKVQEGIALLQEEVVRSESQANHEEGALMRAMVVWDILNQYLTGKSQPGEHSLAHSRVTVEKEAVQQLYRLYQVKGNYLQGQDVEYLCKDAREKLRSAVQHSLYLVQDLQAKIRSKAPRYSFNLNPEMFEDEGEALQQEFQPDTEGSQPAALRFYKTLRAETAEQLKNLKATALKVAGIERREEEEGFGKDVRPYESGLATNSNMLNDMMRKTGDAGRAYAVEDAIGAEKVEGTSQVWLETRQQMAMAPQAPPPWPQQNQMFPESFGPAQTVSPRGSQFPSFPPPEIPPGRPFPQTQGSGMRPSPESFPPSQPQPPKSMAMAMAMPEQYRPPVPGFPRAGLPRNQPFPGARPLQPVISTGPASQSFWPRGFQEQMSSMPASQSFVPRGFQEQMSSMPQPCAPSNWQAQRPPPQPLMRPANLGQQVPAHDMHGQQVRFPSFGPVLPSPGTMMAGRQQAGPAAQAAMNFTTPRMMQGSSGPNPMQQLASQMQQMRMPPQQGARMPPMQPQMGSMAQPNFLRGPPPQMALAQQNFLRPAVRPTQMVMGQQNLNRAPALQQQFAGTRAGFQRPM